MSPQANPWQVAFVVLLLLLVVTAIAAHQMWRASQARRALEESEAPDIAKARADLAQARLDLLAEEECAERHHAAVLMLSGRVQRLEDYLGLGVPAERKSSEM